MNKGLIANYDLINKACLILSYIPLCDRCLGRFFANYGKGLSNKTRGLAIKTLITMLLPRLKNEFKIDSLVKIVTNMKFKPAINTLRYLEVKIEENEQKCYICEDSLDAIIENYCLKILKETLNYEFKNFLIGVHIPKEIIIREEEIIGHFKIETYESIKNEIKREISKIIQQRTGKQPNFLNPDIVFIINLVNNRVEIESKPLFIYGRYVKAGRRISQVPWLIWRNNKQFKKYELSIEDALQPIAKVFKAERAILHAAGREDVDVRTLGIGRPMIVELRKPKLRRILPERLRKAKAEVKKRSNNYIIVDLIDKTVRENVRKLKEETKTHYKMYRAFICSKNKISTKDIDLVEKTFNNIIVKQRTPIRVLHRRPDVLREKKVFGIKVKIVHENLLEALIKCEGGLYVKELVEGDNGRTNPSLSSVINKELKCLELDVIYVSS